METAHPIKKNKKSFQKMKDLSKRRSFLHRVTLKDKNSVSQYLNEELKRHIDIFYEKQAKVKAEYDAEKTRIRRSYR